MLLLSSVVALPSFAQFGRNKVQYDDFDFKVMTTDRFQIHFYPEEEQAVADAARMAERWYRRHSRTFLREFHEKKPIIFYANDADFHQTNVIGGSLGEGTGGVTEALKQRVVMPLTGSYADTDHVLGHELVHSFQYDIAFSSQADSIRFNIGLLPLWLVEGMAEYLSVGRVDSHTAMWLRDAVARDDLPTMEQLTKDMRYFPYRYGQAYMAYIGGKYGDGAVTNLYKLAGRAGVDTAMVYTLGIDPDSLSKEWQQVVKETYTPLMEGRTPFDQAGRRVIAKDLDGGEMNIAPALSPDGKYVAFLSERDLFNINLFVADAETGRIVKKLGQLSDNPHFDALRFINSAGSWSPDGKKLAFVAFAEGDNRLAVLDLDSGNIEREIAVQSVGAMSNPAWSPDGRTIAFTGLDGGISDIYLLDVATSNVRQITNDAYADLQPTWSPDGKTIAFVTDRGPGGTNFQNLSYAEERLALIDVASGAIQVLQPFNHAIHHNPQFSPDGNSLFFISDQDGFKDIYRLDIASGQTYRITNLVTGVSGITSLSPAMSVASQSGRMMFSVFGDGKYTIFSMEAAETVGTPVVPLGEGVASAGVLPPLRGVDEGLVGNYLNDPLSGLPPADREFPVKDYRTRLTLDYVAPPTIGASTGGMWGTRVSGGVGFFFSDMLGNHNLTVVAQANGTVKDIGGQVSYFNQANRFNWGATAGHIPYLTGGGYSYYGQGPDGQLYRVIQIQRYRIFIDHASAIGAYPFSTTKRIEFSGGFVRYGFDFEVETITQDQFGNYNRDRENVDAGDPAFFLQSAAAYVGDYSMTGFTSPVAGGRYRFQVSPLYGTDKFVSVMADYRRYFYFKPLTLAVRGLHVGNYGAPEDTWYGREYLGSTYYPGFVRGYSFNSFDGSECTTIPGLQGQSSCGEMDRLVGSRIALASAEFRVPLLGTEQLGLINFPYLPTELSLFTDAGLAWTSSQKPVLKWDTDTAERVPVVSAGVSTRINLFGYMVFEIFYAYPFQRPDKGAHFGFQLSPGW